MDNLNIQDSFDVEVESPSLTSHQEAVLWSPQFAVVGEMSVHHQDPKGNTLDFDKGENLILTGGKKNIAQYLWGQVDNRVSTDTSVSGAPYNRISLGRGGATSVAATQLALTTEYHSKSTLDSPASGATGELVIVKDATGTSGSNIHQGVAATYPRNLRCMKVSATDSTKDFHLYADATGLIMTWYAKFTFDGIDTYYSGTGNSIIVNEAGIANATGITGNPITGAGNNALLARRTFTNKSVKDADTLTITWKITIK